MAGSRESGLKAAATLKKRDPDFYSKIGGIGGKKITKNTRKRGFASMDKKTLSELSRKGGRSSVRAKTSSKIVNRNKTIIDKYK